MAKIDQEYHKLLNEIKTKGFKYEDSNRKGVYRYQIPSYQMVHNFDDGFPAITTKQLYWKGIVGELLWILRGDTNIKYLVDNNINIWNKDAYNYYLKQGNEAGHKPKDKVMLTFTEWLQEIKEGENLLGDLGRVYGSQWRNWKDLGVHLGYNDKGYPETTIKNDGVDQISNLIKGLKENPMGTKHIVTAWNPAELNDMALPPCHWSFEVLVEPLSTFDRCVIKTPTTTNKDIGSHAHHTINKWLDENRIPKYQFTLKWHQRSVDSFLGLPFNIASYALLAQIIGKMTNMIPKGIVGDLSNVHIYEPHLNAVKTQLSRDFNKYDKTKVLMLDEFHYLTDEDLVGNLSTDEIIKKLRIDMFKLDNYKSYPKITAEMLAYDNK